MPRLSSAAVTVLSRSLVCLLLLSAADAAVAQTLTANGSTGPLSIYRGDTVTITTSGISTDWVGLFEVGAANGSYKDWFYLNGTKSSSPAPSNPAVITSMATDFSHWGPHHREGGQTSVRVSSLVT